MAVEASHFRNCEYADGTKGMGCNRQNLALCDVSPQLVVRGGLQAVKGDITGDNISFQSTVCHFNRKGSRHDHLILHAAECQLSGAGIAAVEAHEGILMGVIKFAFDRLFIHIVGHAVVDIQ